MRIYQIRRYLKRLCPAPGAIPIRLIILATLINVAVVFGSVTNNQRRDSDQQFDQTGAQPLHQDGRQESFWPWVFHHPGDFSGVMVAIFNGLLVYVTYRLVASTNKLWDAGERQLRQLKESAQRQLRAYVLADRVDLIGGVSPFPKIRAVFKNSGQTPAYEMKIWADVCVATDPIEGRPLGPSAHEDGPESPIGSQGTATVLKTPNEALSQSEIDTIGQKGTGLYFFGQIFYKDTFGISRQTNFCYIYGHESAHNGIDRLQIYQKYNECT